MPTSLSRSDLSFIGILSVVFLFLFSIAPPVYPENQPSEIPNVTDELDEELRYLKAETYVITASKVLENIKKAPASITVITDRQLRQMGAKHLNDALNRTVPGLWSHLGWDAGNFYPFVRGRAAVLLMINGHPIYNLWFSLSAVYDTMNVDNIKRIEVLRGPGSALYGANAYDGVINIITKEAEDINGIELTARGGSWDTQQYNILFGKTLRDLEMVFNVNYFKTHGHRAFIKEDVYTPIDRILAPLGIPPASLAPGRTKRGDEKYDAALNLKFKGFAFDGGYVDREWNGPFPNNPVLTEKGGDLGDEAYYLNFSYETTIKDRIDLLGKVYRNYSDIVDNQQAWPSGASSWIPNPTPPPAFMVYQWPEGILEKMSHKDSRNGIEIQTNYQVSDSNTIVAGATYEELKYYDVDFLGNYQVTDLTAPDGSIVSIPLPSMQKVEHDFWLYHWKRRFQAVFLEDIWDITPNIRLTAGIRYDHYSDFGSHLSPRIGITWEYCKGYDLKLLYGHAFRAPTAFEIMLWAPDSTLGPETVDSYEISLGADFTNSFSGRLTLYQKDEKDLIQVDWSALSIMRFSNRGSKRWRGFEVEAKYDFGRGTYIAGNYTYSDTAQSRDFPKVSGKLMSNIRLSRHLNVYADCIHIGGMHRMPGDLREDTSSYTYVNATVIARNLLKGYEGLELRGSVYNLFDEDWSDWVDGLPYGWPKPGINFLLEMKYSF